MCLRCGRRQLSVCCTLCVRQVNKNYPANAKRKMISLSLGRKREADGLVCSGHDSPLVREKQNPSVILSYMLHRQNTKGGYILLLGTISSGFIMCRLSWKTQRTPRISTGGVKEGILRTTQVEKSGQKLLRISMCFQILEEHKDGSSGEREPSPFSP